jgi:predicted GNAT family N-acyltransferase
VRLFDRLAVDDSMKGKGVGQFLLMNALHRILQAAPNIAATAVVVDAKDDAAEAFYRQYGFIALQQQPGALVFVDENRRFGAV